MKAAVLHEVNKPLVIEDVDDQQAGGARGADPHRLRRAVPFRPAFHRGPLSASAARRPRPRVRGHRRGRSAPRSPTSRRATTSSPASPCSAAPATTARPGGRSSAPTPSVKMLPGVAKRLSLNGKPLHTFTNLSSYAEMMLVHENAIVKIGDDFPLDRAALIGCGVITGYGAAVNTAKVAPGETVAVIGCGGVGMAAINGAAIAGAGPHHRHRHQPGEAAAGHQARRHRSRQSQGRRSRPAGQGPDEGRRASRHRVPRHQDHRRAGVPDAGGRRHRHHRRHGAVRAEDRAARLRLPARAQDPGLVDGLQPLPRRHAAADRVLQAAQAAPRRLDLRPHQARPRSTRASPT